MYYNHQSFEHLVGSIVEKYSVCFQSSDSSERVGLHGHLQLIIFTHGLGVSDFNSGYCSVLWPVSVIRQYRLQSLGSIKSKKKSEQLTVVTLEIGR